MHRFIYPARCRALAFAAVLCLLCGSLRGLGAATNDPLAEYVAKPDASFAWKIVEQREVDGLAAARLECTSQTWRGNAWHHELLVVRPREVRNPDVAFLSISGDGSLDKQFGLLRTLAMSGGAVAAAINRVPNQPLYGGRKEDALIAYTFDQYLRTGDQTWPLLFPMVKSAARGMDAVQAFARQELKQKVERFVVAGASKRGWTTWLSAAVDPRVQAIAPMVIDMLNMKVQTQWAEKIYGKQSEQIHDYTELNLTDKMDEPRMVELRNLVDPYSYRARYNLPKLLLLGTNDPYWVVDSLRHYWKDLPEPKLVFQTPNAAHDLAGGRMATPTLAAFFQMVAERRPLPQMTWDFKPGPSNSVALNVTIQPPARVFRLWTADSPIRDMRKAHWTSQVVASDNGTRLIGKVQAPEEGFRAYLVEAELANEAGQPYRFSTEARVTPE